MKSLTLMALPIAPLLEFVERYVFGDWEFVKFLIVLVVIDTSLGRLTVKGSGLHIVNFDTKSGDLSAEGRLYALVYTTEEKNGGFFSRVFR